VQLSSALSPDGKTLVYGDEWGSCSAACRRQEGMGIKRQRSLYIALKYSPDGRFVSGVLYDNKNLGKGVKLVVRDANRAAKYWQGPDGTLGVERRFQGQQVDCSGGKGDNKPPGICSVCRKAILCMSRKTWPRLAPAALFHRRHPSRLGFADGTVHIWTGREEAVLSWNATSTSIEEGHCVAAVAFSPDGKTLATLATRATPSLDLTASATSKLLPRALVLRCVGASLDAPYVLLRTAPR